jgi:hypothetical protein
MKQWLIVLFAVAMCSFLAGGIYFAAVQSGPELQPENNAPVLGPVGVSGSPVTARWDFLTPKA